MSYLQQAVRRQVEQRGLRPFARSFGVPVGQVRSVCAGRAARSDTIERLTDALGLEFYVGPPRPPAAAAGSGAGGLSRATLRGLEFGVRAINRAVAEAGGDPVPDELWPVLAARRGLGPDDDPGPAPDTVPGPAPPETGDLPRPVPDPDPGIPVRGLPPGARPVDVVELAAAAGGGTEALGEAVAGCVWFRQDWLDRRSLDPTHCVVIRVSGESMEPLLREGDSILVDRKRRRRIQDRIFVVRTEDGLVVKRAGRGGDGGWQLISEHPSWAPVPWPAEAETIGQAVWTARSLV